MTSITEDLSPEHIREVSEQLVRVVTSPQYLEVSAEINALPAEDRLEATANLLTVDSLRARGLDIPDGLRISPRWFEPPEAGAASEDADVMAHVAPAAAGPITTCVSVGVVVCVSVGKSAE